MNIFNPRATTRIVQFDERHFCVVIDDALVDPERLRRFAASRASQFRTVDFSAYPGIYLAAPEDTVTALIDLFQQQVRRRFDARRCVEVHCRLSMVTVPPAALRPRQWLCHVDDALVAPGHSMQASVLYLFEDEGLGGTSFYVPRRSRDETNAMLKDSDTLTAAEFSRKYGIQAGYMHQSNDYYTRIGEVAPRWNRLIFYSGGMLHAGDVPDPARLNADPRTGRLTLNGFFTCRRNLA